MNDGVIQLRPAEAGDSELAFGILKSALGPYIDQQFGWDEDEQRKIHGGRFRPESAWFIMQDGVEVGLISVDRKPDHIHLRQLFITDRSQGRGIGSRILKGLMDESNERGVPINLRVLKVNPRALDFYVGHGFTISGETDTHHLVEYRPEARQV